MIKIFKRAVITALLLIAFLLVGVSATFLIISDSLLITKIVEKVQSATETRITYQKGATISRTLMPVISINNFILEDSNKNCKIESTSLKIQINLPRILLGKLEIPFLALGDTRVKLKKTKAFQVKETQNHLSFAPVLENIQISNISISSENHDLAIPKIDIKNFKANMTSNLEEILCTFETEIKGNLFDIETRLPKLQNVLQSKNLPLSLIAKNNLSRLFIKGFIDFSQPLMKTEAYIEVESKGIPGFSFKKLDLPKQINFSSRISGTLNHLHIYDCQLDFKSNKELDINIAGQLDLIKDQSEIKPQNIDLSLKFSAPDTHSARIFFFNGIPEFGAVQGQTKILSSISDPSLENILVTAKDEKGITVEVSGRIDKLPLNPEISNSGYDLKVKMRSEKASTLGERLDLNIPQQTPLYISYNISGDTNALAFNNINLLIGSKDHDEIRANGKMLFGNWNQSDPLKHIDLTVELKTKNIHEFGKNIKRQLPNLGPANAKCRIHTLSGKHRVDNIHIEAGTLEPLKLLLTGSVDHFSILPEPALAGIELLVTASGKDTSDITDIFFLKKSIPPLGNFKAKAKISGSSKRLGADELSFRSELNHKDKLLLDLNIKGKFKDFRQIESLSLSADMNAKDFATIGSVFNKEWPVIGPIKLHSLITSKDDGVKLETSLFVKDIHINASNSIFFRQHPPRISGHIQAQNFFFPDLIEIEKLEVNKNRLSDRHIFSRSPFNFDWLTRADLNLSIDIKSFNKKRSHCESANLKIDLESGHLSVRPARLSFPKGIIDFEALFNLKKKHDLNFKAVGKDINPYQAFSMDQTGMEKNFNADFDLDLELKTSGLSEHEFASNLEGNIYLNLKNGRLKKNILDLLFVDVIGWTFNKTIGEKYVEIECGILDLSINQGLVNTDAFFLDGKNIEIAGEGAIDLEKEEINFLFLPSKNSSFIKTAAPVKIKGPLNNPSIKTIPWRSVAKTYGSLVVSPYLFAGQLIIGLINDEISNQRLDSACEIYEAIRKQTNITPESR
jgi:hypothetical protein